MTGGKVHPLIRFLRRVVSAGPAGDPADEQLLEGFLAEGSQAAFAALVRRYGPLVLGVCRRVLRDGHDAEDAFQATFLVLARKAGSLRRRELLGNWLYGVAYRTAQKARARAARRRAREQPVRDVASPECVNDPAREELRSVLGEEVRRLPAKYRVPVVLCYLEGQTNQEASRRLGCPVGTVKGRLTRARQLLRTRLVRRGLTLSAGALAGALAEGSAAAVPPALAEATARVGPAAAAGPTAVAQAVPPQVIRLAEGVLRTMTLFSLKNVAVTLLLALLVALAGVGLLTHRTRAAGLAGVKAGTSKAAAGKPKDSARRRKPVSEDEAFAEYELAIQKERSLNNMKLLGLAMHRYHKANGTFPTAAVWSKKGKPLLSWRVLLLPYLGKEDLYKQFKLDEPWDGAHNKKLLARMPDVYAPVRGRPKRRDATYYQVFTGKGAAFEGKKGMRMPFSFPDGTTNTILIVEAGEAVPWTKPADRPYDPDKPLPKLGGQFKDGFHVTLADGSARFVKRSISDITLRAAITRAGGEVLGKDWD